jgi:hypothetical protein
VLSEIIPADLVQPMQTLANQKRSCYDKTYSLIPDPPVIPGEDPQAHPQPQALTKPVLFAILNYGCLAILEISYLSLMTVFFAGMSNALTALPSFDSPGNHLQFKCRLPLVAWVFSLPR